MRASLRGSFPLPWAIRARRPSPLHFRWHSSNVPGLGRQPQLPSSEAAAAPLAAAPGVRSEPRPALDPVPRPPPSGGSVKPGGEGGGGGSPTRDGVGGGGGPAGGELAANTFPMVSARGKVRGQGSGATRTPRMRPQALPTQRGLGSHWRRLRRLFPAWAPLLPRALCATEPAAAAAAVSPPHGTYWFGVLRGPPTALEEGHSIGDLAGSPTLLVETLIFIGYQSKSVSAASSTFLLARVSRVHWFAKPRGWSLFAICRYHTY